MKKREWKNKEPLKQRFDRKVLVVDSGCHEWTGTMADTGYGLFKVGRKNWKAHKWNYEQLYGAVADGLQLDHLCRNRRCVNPDHLEPVTHAENLRRGREFLIKPTHCGRGHEFTEANTYLGRCRICIRDGRARRRALK